MDTNNSLPPPSSAYGSTPPPIMPPLGRRPPPRRSWGWMIISLLLAVLLFFSLLLNFTSLGSLLPSSVKPEAHAGPRLDEVLLRSENNATAKIAVVDVDGIISGSRIDRTGVSLPTLIKAQFRKAEKDPRVKAVILRVDSPGGEVLASDEINRIITDFQNKTGKPVVASMGDLAASGGYYVSVASRWIVANELTITGSIGVILSSWNYRSLMDKVGVQPVVYKSGRFKDMLSGSRSPEQIPPEEKQMVQSLIDQTFQKFKSVVKAGRDRAAQENSSAGHPLAADWESYADGRILTGKEALDLGFVDELGDFDDAVKRTKSIAGVKLANLVEYRQVFDLGDLFGLFSRAEPHTVKLELGIEPPKLRSGLPYFLAPTFIQ